MSEVADLEIGFISGKTFQDIAGPEDRVDQISVSRLRVHFTIKTIYLILKQISDRFTIKTIHLILQLTLFVKYFLMERCLKKAASIHSPSDRSRIWTLPASLSPPGTARGLLCRGITL